MKKWSGILVFTVRHACPSARSPAWRRLICSTAPPNPGENYRVGLGRLITSDFQFARASVNYLWEQFFGIGLVSPSDQFDPARLDPDNPPPDPWTLQPMAAECGFAGLHRQPLRHKGADTGDGELAGVSAFRAIRRKKVESRLGESVRAEAGPPVIRRLRPRIFPGEIRSVQIFAGRDRAAGHYQRRRRNASGSAADPAPRHRRSVAHQLTARPAARGPERLLRFVAQADVQLGGDASVRQGAAAHASFSQSSWL
jgi:hypothetical protein